MPRRALHAAAGIVLHILNRSARRSRLFFDDDDYRAFEIVLAQAVQRIPTRLLAYCVMPNHWHLVVWPVADEIPRLMHWLTLTHARRWHGKHGSAGTGHVYQNRYRAIPVQNDRHLLTLIRYVERNPLRAALVPNAENWRWSSLWARCNSCEPVALSEWPIAQPVDWIEIVNGVPPDAELKTVRAAVKTGRPLGEAAWAADAAATCGLMRRPRGRPRRNSHRV